MATLKADLGHPWIRVPVVPMSMLMIAGAVAFLAVVAAGSAQTQADLHVALWVQAIDVPGLGGLTTLANFLTSAPMAIGLWLAATTFFVLRGRPLEAIAVFSIFGLWIVNQFVGVVVDRPAPSSAVSEMSRADSGSFPSGHTTGAVVFYGTLTFLAFSNMGKTPLKVWVFVGAVAIVGITAMSRVYVGAHWPSDVLASLLIGSLGVVAIGHVYTLIKEDRFSLPRFHKRQAPPTIDGVTVTGSVASRVYLDWSGWDRHQRVQASVAGQSAVLGGISGAVPVSVQQTRFGGGCGQPQDRGAADASPLRPGHDCAGIEHRRDWRSIPAGH